MLRRAEAANATTPQFAVLYPCSSRPFERRWYSDTIFAGHEIVCFSKATIEDVRRAAVLVDSFVNHRNRPEGLSVKSLLLKRLGLPYDVMRGKVLVHINDEYGGRPLNDRLTAVYCDLYAPFAWVFRTYWCKSWNHLIDVQGHWHNCTSQACGSGGGPTRVEWVPLGWSANWFAQRARYPGMAAPTATAGAAAPPAASIPSAVGPSRFPASSQRTAFVGFYGNEKAKTHRGRLIAFFEQKTKVSVTRMLGHSGFAKGNATDYVSKMRDTRLCLQIAGLSTECYRLYESLDAGCVPILIDNMAAQAQATAAEQYRFLLHGGGALPMDGTAAPFPYATSPEFLAQPTR